TLSWRSAPITRSTLSSLSQSSCSTRALHSFPTRRSSDLMLEKAGYEIVPFKEGADVYVINTCTVTNIADRKSRQMLHRARKMNPDAVVVAAGCYVQAQDGKGQDPCIDIVLGNNHKKDLVRILDEYAAKRASAAEIEDISRTREYESLHLT